MAVYFRYEKARVERQRIADASKGVGKPKVGGPFELVDQDGRVWASEREMKGRYALVSVVFPFSGVWFLLLMDLSRSLRRIPKQKPD